MRPENLRTSFWRYFFFMFGYGVFCLAAALLLAELAGMAAVGVYHGLFLTTSSVAKGLPPPRGGRAVFSLRSRLDDDMQSASSAYDGRSWAEEFWRERRASSVATSFRYEPFRVWGNASFHGKYLNADETNKGILRRTINRCEGRQKQRADVWFFGGSTAFSAETPDFATIPSYLSQELNRQDRGCVEVANMGVPGYVINQEMIQLIGLLKAGHRPDAVVFYDGANDADVGAYSPAIAWAHGDFLEIKAKFESAVDVAGIEERSYAFRAARGILRRLKRPVLVAAGSDGKAVAMSLSEEALSRKAGAALDNYEANIRLIKSLGKEYGFRAYFFWQPVLAYGNRSKTPFEEILNAHPLFASKDENRAVAAVYREAERRAALKRGFSFLGRAFDRIGEPIYVDSVHLGPQGNKIIAETMAPIVR